MYQRGRSDVYREFLINIFIKQAMKIIFKPCVSSSLGNNWLYIYILPCNHVINAITLSNFQSIYIYCLRQISPVPWGFPGYALGLAHPSVWHTCSYKGGYSKLGGQKLSELLLLSRLATRSWPQPSSSSPHNQLVWGLKSDWKKRSSGVDSGVDGISAMKNPVIIHSWWNFCVEIFMMKFPWWNF